MNPEDNYQLYLMKYQEARHPEVPKSRMELAFEHNLEDSFFMTHMRIFNGEDYERFIENPFPEKPRLRWQGNEGGYEK